MKAKIISSIVITLLIGLLLISGCATTGKIKEPTKSDSALIVGRVKMVCSNFPRDWHINGEHTSNIRVYFIDPATNDVVIVKSKGDSGVFYLVDPDAKQFVIAGFEIRKKIGNMTYTNSHRIDNTYIDITRNSVNNMGDLVWDTRFKSQDARGGGSSTYTTDSKHDFKSNYNEVESWFNETFAESPWNRKEWVNVEYKRF
jgi:hypothetical protein